MWRDRSPEIWLFTARPTPRQTRIAVAIALVLLVGFGVCAPLADIPLRRIDSFIPAVEGAVIITDFITSVLLFSQAEISRSRALLALASGYLLTSLIVVSHVLTFPGALSPTGLLGAGPQTAGWLYVFWHFGLATATVVYAGLKHEKFDDVPTTRTRTLVPIGWTIAIVVTVVCGLTLFVTLGESILPRVFWILCTLRPWGVSSSHSTGSFVQPRLHCCGASKDAQRSISGSWL
jgi:hypothetical protein